MSKEEPSTAAPEKHLLEYINREPVASASPQCSGWTRPDCMSTWGSNYGGSASQTREPKTLQEVPTAA